MYRFCQYDKSLDEIIMSLFIFLATKAYQQIKILIKPSISSVLISQRYGIRRLRDQGQIYMQSCKLSCVRKKLSVSNFSLRESGWATLTVYIRGTAFDRIILNIFSMLLIICIHMDFGGHLRCHSECLTCMFEYLSDTVQVGSII